MDIKSSFKILGWIGDKLIQGIKSDFEALQRNSQQHSQDIRDLVKVCKELSDKLAKLEGKYENAVDTVYQKVENNLLRGKVLSQEKIIEDLKQPRPKFLPEQENNSVPLPEQS